MNQAKVNLAAGLPLTWVAAQKEDFRKYLLQNVSVDFIFHNKEYHVEFVGADIYSQGFAAAFYRLQDFKGINMLADIGNGTMNIMYINNSRPVEKKCFTEKYGTHQGGPVLRTFEKYSGVDGNSVLRILIRKAKCCRGRK